MTYTVPVFTEPVSGSPESTLVAGLLKSKVLWTGPEVAEIVGCSAKAACKRLNKLAVAGVIVRLGSSGPGARWCRVEFKEEGLRQWNEWAASVVKNRQKRHSLKRSERRAAARMAKALPPIRNAPKVDRPAFTIPPRGVPCSVWALAAA